MVNGGWTHLALTFQALRLPGTEHRGAWQCPAHTNYRVENL